MKSKTHWLLLFPALLLCATTTANNIQVTNPSLVGNTGTSVKVQFDINWENSWRGGGAANWDAAWVFVKYRSSATTEWQHLRLGNTGHTSPAGSRIDPGLFSPNMTYDALNNPVLGVFIYRDTPGSGALSLPMVELQVDLAAAGLSITDLFQIQVFAIEMVHVPQGVFRTGPNAGTGEFIATSIITSNATTPVSNGAWSSQGGYPGGTPPLNAAWPNGFGAFYCMKYEVTQQGYVDFLNTLSFFQQSERTVSAPNSAIGTGAMTSTNANRNGIDIRTPGVAVNPINQSIPAIYACNLNGNGIFLDANEGRDIACNWLSWADLSAYLDWSGLRPMSEMEFEKACRGPLSEIYGEYASGSTTLATTPYTLANTGTATEGINTNYSGSSTNISYQATAGAINGPLRVGIFAANGSNTGRVSSGASYYGIMELSGNVWELAVMLDGSGLSFLGTHGNGLLGGSGRHDVATWPSPDFTDGVISRGGGWNSAPPYLWVHSRVVAVNFRHMAYGGRGVRSAP